MCGIIGCVGEVNGGVAEVLESGLGKLEYRGYDSVGVALLDSKLTIYKQTGTVDSLELPPKQNVSVGIGHTRWATHGPPTDENAHPHTDCTGTVAVVHNGIITNYEELREQLLSHEFRSQTDTEVIPHLIEEALGKGLSLLGAVTSVVTQLEGSFAIAVVAEGYEGMVAARQNSPLVIGHGDGQHFVASDVTGFLGYTRDVTYLENGDIVHVTATGVSVFSGGDRVDRQVVRTNWEASQASKSGYDHFMLKEIHEQPQVVNQTIAGRIDSANGRVILPMKLSVEEIESLEDIHIVACGTSYHAGLYAAKFLGSMCDVRTSVEIASEYQFPNGTDPARTLVILVSQSGETADTIEAGRRAKMARARTLGVTNVVGSSLSREVDTFVYIHAGPEIGVAATKSFVAQVVTMALVAIHFGRNRGTLSADEARVHLSDLSRLPQAIQYALDAEAIVQELATEHARRDGYFFIGREYGFPVALEAALKLKEISYRHAEGFAAGELKHGPLALVSPETLVISLSTHGTNPDKTRSNIEEVRSRGAPVISVTSEREMEAAQVSATLDVPPVGIFEPLVANVYLQLFAYYVAAANECSIDKPKNLAKSVTVE